VRQPRKPRTVPDPQHAAGRWVSADGSAFDVAVRGEDLFIASGGVERPLMLQGSALVTDHPALAPYWLARVEGMPEAVRLGDRLFGKEAPPAAVTTLPKVAALAGSYLNSGAWGGNRITVHALGDRLYAGPAELAEAPDGSWRFTDPGDASERIWFDAVANGRPQRMNVSGSRFTRLADG
jgi:hypothetical protein